MIVASDIALCPLVCCFSQRLCVDKHLALFLGFLHPEPSFFLICHFQTSTSVTTNQSFYEKNDQMSNAADRFGWLQFGPILNIVFLFYSLFAHSIWDFHN
jgi:hypothetical protein